MLKTKMNSDIQMDDATVKIAEVGKKRQQCRQEISETILIPADFVNLNRIRITYKCGKAQVNLKRTFRPEHLQYLKQIHRLDSVTFANDYIVNAGVLTELVPLNLRYLKIGSGCTDTDLAALEGFRYLERLNIDCSCATNTGLAHLQKLTQLTHLYIHVDDSITDEGLAPLTHLKHLEKLCIIRHSDLYGDGCFHKPIMWKNLRQFGRPAKLQELAIIGNCWTDDSIKRFAQWCSHLPQLKMLTLSRDGCADENLHHYLGGTIVSDEYTTRWASNRTYQEVLEYMMLERSPVSRRQLEQMFPCEMRSEHWKLVLLMIIHFLVSSGVLVKIDDGDGIKFALSNELIDTSSLHDKLDAITKPANNLSMQVADSETTRDRLGKLVQKTLRDAQKILRDAQESDAADIENDLPF